MTIKCRYILIIFVAFLTACGITPQSDEMTKVQNTALAMARIGVALTQTAMPTSTLPPPTFTPTATIVYPAQSPIPTQLHPPILTPDAIQLERWKEYQTELAKVLLYGYGPDAYKDALCEWDILGHSDQKVYVWAYCAPTGGGSGSLPAVIQFKNDGAVQKVSAPAINNSTWDSQIRKMFPVVVQEKLDLYYFNVCVYCGRPEELRIHILYRQAHPEIPPLIVLSAIPTATPTP